MPSLRNAFSYQGRLARLPYFLLSLGIGIAAALLVAAGGILLERGHALPGWLLWLIALVLVFGAGSAIVVRRPHDLGQPGGHVVWLLILTVLAGAIDHSQTAALIALNVLLALAGLALVLLPGQAGANAYGPPPG